MDCSNQPEDRDLSDLTRVDVSDARHHPHEARVLVLRDRRRDRHPGEAKRELAPKWEHECRILLEAGADVIVPAGGLPMMLFGAERGANIDGAPIVNGITLIAKTAELAIRLREQAGMFTVSRRSNYVKPPEKALREFLEQG